MEKILENAYLVGGAVRDQLLGLETKDRDWVVVGCTENEMLEAGFQRVGRDFPVFLHPQSHEEYALARTEKKVSAGYQGFVTHSAPDVTLEEDLSRRDLTINAIAIDANGDLIDPFGGQRDIAEKKLTHVTAAFNEDPLRVLRTARFAARLFHLGFSIADETRSLMTELSESGELNALATERIWQETDRALAEKNPRVFFEQLRSCRALCRIYPEIDMLFGVDQRPKYHPEIDAGLHTMLSLDQICLQTKKTKVRFATLVHDLGKATTPANILPSHRGHEQRGAVLVDQLCDRLKIQNSYRQLAVRVARLHLKCHKAFELKSSTIEKLLSDLDCWRNEEYLSEFVECCRADARGRTGLESRPYPQYEYLLECADAAKAVNTDYLREQGFEGKRLGDAIRQERIKRIEAIKQNYKDIDEKQFSTIRGHR